MENELNSGFFNNPNWENSAPVDHNDPFESALSSMVSSPTNGENNNGSNVVRELIGRLGSICSSPLNAANNNNNNNSTNNSCYSTPLNSPPKLNLSIMENQQIRGTNLQNHFPPFSTDPAFAERAARFSSFANNNLVGLNEIAPNLDSAKISRVPSNQSLRISPGSPPMAALVNGSKDIEKKFRSSAPENAEFGDSRENSSVSDANASSRKRKSIPKGRGKDATPAAKDANVASENSESNAKRSKIEDEKDAAKNIDEKQSKDNSKPPEAPKDYIHVRARRGQATDAHSLAERVRREKISERMKVLQDLVPGCNKVTGKAVMLDEIINYVQSLQRQVEFLSMKLATVNPRMEFNVEALVPKDVFQSRGSLPQNMYASDGYPFQSQPSLQTEVPFPANTFSAAAMGRNQLPCMDNFSGTPSQVSTFWEDDLHSVVQMGFGQNQTQNFHGIVPTSQMKIEL